MDLVQTISVRYECSHAFLDVMDVGRLIVIQVLGLTVLMCAARHGHSEVVRLLMESGASIDHPHAEVCTYVG